MDYEHIEKLLGTQRRLVALESGYTDLVLKGFREYSRFSGKAVYVWEEGIGLYRMEASHIKIPNTVSPQQVLKYIEKVPHFGIYLLKGFNQFLNDGSFQASLRKLSESSNCYKMAVIIDNELTIPQCIFGQIVLTKPMIAPLLAQTA